LSTPKVRKETIGSLTNTSNLSSNINIGKNNTHIRTGSHEESKKLSLNDLKSPIGDVHIYSNHSNSNSKGVNKSSEEINLVRNDKDNMRILSNTNLFSYKESKHNSEILIEQLNKSELKSNPEFMDQLSRLISHHSATDVKELSNNKSNRTPTQNDNSNNSYELNDLKIDRAIQRANIDGI